MIPLPVKNRLFFLSIILLLSINPLFSQISIKEKWVDSVFNTLTPDQRIAQLLMIRGYSNRDAQYNDDLIKLVTEFKLGGVCFFQGGPVRQAIITNRIQENSSIPAFIAIDGEWGLGMRLDSSFSFPKQMTLGAIRNDQYIYEMGTEVARQLVRLGIHMNFAPVADINNNPLNPVINARSFGENRLRVAEKSYFYMKGMQDAGIIAVCKHFPGHGDTDTDSHYSLPIIDKSRSLIDSVELFPFRYLIERGIKGIMVSHLRVPALDTAVRSIATLSEPILQGLLRNEMGFKGMIITDGMDMKGLVDYSDVGNVEADALKAGNDILLLPVDARAAIRNICNAIDRGYITQKLIDEKCRRVLTWKYESGLSKKQNIELKGLIDDLNTWNARLITLRSNERAITMVKNDLRRVPVRYPDTLSIASIVIGDTSITPFQQVLAKYAPVTHFNLPGNPTNAQKDSLSCLLEPFNLVIAGFTRSSDLPQKRFNVTESAAAYIDSLAGEKSVILSLFASPYSIDFFRNSDQIESIIVSYQDNALMQELTAQAIFGGRTIDGLLPVSANAIFRAGCGLESNEKLRVSFAMPEELMITSNDLKPIDSIVTDAISKKVFPGAQIVVIKDGRVILNKAYGSHIYDSKVPLRTDDLFDLASLTKILGTTMMAMKLKDDLVINPDKKLSFYYDKLKKSNKKDITIKQIMAHEARLQSFIPFYEGFSTDTSQPLNELLARHYSINYTHRIADNLYSREDLPDIIIDSIIKSDLLVKKGYKYSDLGFILLARAFEQLVDQPFSHWLNRNFYNRMGLPTMGFNPRNRFSLTRIVPTEQDRTFRRQLIHGDVHDQTAALLGGVAGNAGLFSDALDVGILMQMLLQNGKYAGETYIDSTTVAEFTAAQFPGRGNRRGAGFDRPPLNPDDPSPACNSVSPLSYGHSGFTGTYVWVDPAEQLVYVFLSNRVYPDAANSKITQMNIRTNIHEVIYKAIRNSKN